MIKDIAYKTVYCDGPGYGANDKCGTFDTVPDGTPEEIQAELKRRGWQRIGDDDICPLHGGELRKKD